MIGFSIIIAVRAINEYLRENISKLGSIQYDNFEVIIILDREEEYDFKGDTRFKILVSGPVGPGEKRNIGAKEAVKDILVFLDDDAYPAADWLMQASRVFDNPQVYALGGPAVTPLDAGFLEKMSGRVLESRLASGFTIYRHIPMSERLIDDYPTVNLFVRKPAFSEIGGFPLEFWPGEDTKLCLDLVNKFGRKFLYNPLPVVFHHRRNLFGPHLKQISRYGRHRGQFARIFPQTSRIPQYFAPSLFITGLIFGPLVSYFFPLLYKLYLTVIYTYISLTVLEMINVYRKDHSIKASLYVAAGIFLTHVVYGINFITGFIMKPRLKLKAVDTKTGNYSEG
jgi:cellulose synthase/poly-beta-1,6-N-acetylglucosamine synthase-like glycosyltransferase